jgi:hypothetical protein
LEPLYFTMGSGVFPTKDLEYNRAPVDMVGSPIKMKTEDLQWSPSSLL